MRQIKLYPHNLLAYEKVVKMLKEEGKAAIIHPTGTGKSFIAFALARDNQDKKFIWLSPSEYIYELQCKNLWQKQHMKLSNIDFHTYTWLIHNDEIIAKLKADYIILDEFHRTGAREWEKSVRKLIDTLPDAYILGLSATKVRYLDNKRDMADEIFEGCIASEINICEAMAAGILPKPKYVIASYSYEQKR
jgi:superfamily II DNA or RNA helicase